MSYNIYGTLGSTNDPKDLALRYLKKVMTNHKNALKFMGMNDLQSVEERFDNTIHVLEELDLMLNHEDGNKGVVMTSDLLHDMMNDCDAISSLIEIESLDAGYLEERISNHLIVLENLYVGFKGMAY